MKSKIVAIGGGEIGRPNPDGGFYPVETSRIDKQAIALTGKKKPRLLFIPTASSDAKRYYTTVDKHFSKLGCKTDVLYLLSDELTKKQIKEKILSADIIYVGGGNTLKMMNEWRKRNVDKILKQAYHKGVVMTGVSAGAICWFSFGNSDSRKYASNSNQLIKVSGLGLVDILFCPHYDFEPHRQKDLKRMMKVTPRVLAVAVDNCAALEIVDDEYRVLTSKPNAQAYKIYWKRGKFFKEKLSADKEYRPLNDLLTK